MQAGLRLLFVLVISLCGVAAPQDTITGRVSDLSGRPLDDVRVVSWFGEEVRTDDLGQFKLSRPAELIRFSKDGHQPVTIVIEARMASVILKPATGASWKPPVCSQGPSRFGDGMLFATPRGARLHKEADVDYSTVSIRYAGATLVFGTGIYWTYGLPFPTTLREMITVEERDVQTPRGLLAAEYRGRRADGTRWREVLIFGESIECDRANAKAAAYFDQIIDSLCFRAVEVRAQLQPR